MRRVLIIALLVAALAALYVFFRAPPCDNHQTGIVKTLDCP